MQVSSQEQPAEKIAAASEDLKAQDAPPPSVIDDNYSDDPDEDDKPVTLMDRLTETLLDSAPITAGDSNDLARFGVIAPMTLLYFAVFFSTLLWFTISGAQTIAAQHFLSVLEQEGDICSSVPYYINNVFSADSSGRWSTAPLYLANESIYQLHFTGEAVTTSQFYSAMQQFSANVKTLGAKAAERDLAFTYLALNNYGFVHEPTKLQFTSKALAGTTLGHMKVRGTRGGVCWGKGGGEGAEVESGEGLVWFLAAPSYPIPNRPPAHPTSIIIAPLSRPPARFGQPQFRAGSGCAGARSFPPSRSARRRWE